MQGKRAPAYTLDAATWHTLDAATQAKLAAERPQAVAAILHQIEREADARRKSEALEALRQRQATPDAGDASKPASTPDNAPDDAGASEEASTPTGAADAAPATSAKPKTKRELEEEKRERRRLAKEAEKAAREAEAAARRENNRQVRESCGAPHLGGGKAPDVAAALERHYMARTGAPHAYDQGALWLYDEASGLWREFYAEAVHDFLQRKWHGVATTSDESKVWACVNWRGIEEAFYARASGHGQGRGFFDEAAHGLAFRDCFLTVAADGTLHRQPKSPKWRARHGFDFDLPDLDSIRPIAWADYLDSAVPDETGEALLGEALGVALLGVAPRLQKATLLLGPGGSGKSTFQDVAQKIAEQLGPTACTSISPHLWRDGHYLAGLVGSRLNMCAENEAKDFAATAFKAVVTGDAITANPKGLPNFQFKPRAAHIFASNPEDLPSVPDAGPAFWRRWQCVPFTRVFSGMSGERVGLAAHIIANELPGVVAWALRLAEGALKRKAYTRHAAGEAALAEWRGEASPVQMFLDERTIRCAEAAAHGDLLTGVYRGFVGWCESNGYGVPNRATFAKRLAACGYPIRRSRGSRVGLKLLKPGETTDDFLGTSN